MHPLLYCTSKDSLQLIDHPILSLALTMVFRFTSPFCMHDDTFTYVLITQRSNGNEVIVGVGGKQTTIIHLD